MNLKKFRLAAFSFLALSILLISITFFVLSINKPYMGTELSMSDSGWIVESVDDNGQAKQAGIDIGDRPITINGQPAEVFLTKYEQHGVVFGWLINELTVIDNNEIQKSASLNSGSPSWQSTIEIITVFIVCLVFWITGFYVFFKKSRHINALLFCLCGLTIGLVLSANMAGERMIPSAFWFSIITAIIGPWLLLHFFLILPDEQTRLRNTPLAYLIYLPAITTIILLPIIGYSNGQPLPWFRDVRLFEYGLGFLGVIGVVTFNYFYYKTYKTRQQMKIILISCLVSLVPFIFLSIFPEIISGSPIVPVAYSVLFFAFIPIGLGYAVVTQKLMDIDMVIRRGLIYTLIAIIMAIILAAAIFFVVTFGESLNYYEEVVIALALGALATILFGPTKRIAETFIDKFFYKDRYDYQQIIQSVSTALSLHNDPTSISRLVVGTLSNTLNLAGACLFVYSQSEAPELRASHGTFSDVNKQKQLLNLIYQKDNRVGFPISVSSLDPETAFLIPLVIAEKEIGILCLSPKKTGQDFTSSDLYLMQGIATITAIALHSALLVRDVSIRDTFVSIASHELRTPMSSIMGYAELLLQRDPPQDTRKQWLQNIIDNGRFISEMVDDLLNVTRIQAGKVVMKIEKVDLPELINTRVNMVKETDNIHNFTINIEPDLPKAAVDNDKFGEVLGNLLDNAVKYSPNGGCITISSYVDKTKKRIIVSVTDEGIGIIPEDQVSLFTTFHRIQRPETQGVRGNGLGLYIVKEWTEAMGGKIWLHSVIDKGSTFHIAVPIADTEMIH